MSGIETRSSRADEIDSAIEVFLTAMGEQSEGTPGAYLRPIAEPEQVAVACEGDDLVGAALALDATLTLPGPRTAPVAWVTGVGVLPTHRRRGILSGLMTHQLTRLHNAGVAIAGLRATEATIYRRFGYGAAVPELFATVEPRRAAFHTAVETGGTLRLLDPAAARHLIPNLHQRCTAQRPGEVTWAPRYWPALMAAHAAHPVSGARWSTVVHLRADGHPDGYASYLSRYEQARVVVQLQELHATSDDVRAALVQFCLNLDLATAVRLRLAPDDPLWWWLEDSSAVSTKGRGNGACLRVVRVAEALQARRYLVDGRIVLDLRDAILPANNGSWLLEVENGVARCTPTSEPADLQLDVADLGSLLLGGHRPSTLVRAKRISAISDTGVSRADQLFAAERLPFSQGDI